MFKYGKKTDSDDDEKSKKKKSGGKDPYQFRFDADDDDEKLDKYDKTIEDNSDEDDSESIGKKDSCKEKDKELQRRKKVIEVIVKNGMKKRNK